MTDEKSISVVNTMIARMQCELANCERMMELLQPEWERFEARAGHNTYVARDYVNHLNAARKHRKEIAALKALVSCVTGEPA